MKLSIKRFLSLFGLIILASFLFLIPIIAQTKIPKANLPVLSTSAGQSNDVNTINIILEEAGIKYDYCDVPDVDLIKSGVGLADRESGPGFHVEVYTDLSKYPKGTPYKTIIFAIGASLKGMGASGLTVEAEEARLKRIVEYCQKNKIYIIAVHVGGSALRGAPGSDNERMIDAVAPFANHIIVTKDSNKDGRFTNIAKAKNIPLTEVDYALDLVNIFKQIFQ
ncbi:MAG: DUF6305 family protein [Candidatus Aminicenantes bacterium]|nr:DUF6305 family protein [Candidatus Aminicenantes bacterium]